jgi:hypothetical protein
LLRNVEPSTAKGRDELFSVTAGGGPPRSPADAQTDALEVAEEVDIAAVWVEVVEVVAVVEVVDSVSVATEGAPQILSDESSSSSSSSSSSPSLSSSSSEEVSVLLSDWVDFVGLPVPATLN